MIYKNIRKKCWSFILRGEEIERKISVLANILSVYFWKMSFVKSLGLTNDPFNYNRSLCGHICCKMGDRKVRIKYEFFNYIH
jgi:hypothetical protein